MLIDHTKCNACRQCMIYCPVGAIREVCGLIVIDDCKCAECGACTRHAVFMCPVDAIIHGEMTAGRQIAGSFSDPAIYHKKTGVPGRGAEEVKTNDVTGMVRHGEVGVAIEIGRPCIGANFGVIETFRQALYNIGVSFEEKNPLYDYLGKNQSTIIPDDLHKQYLVSAIIQIKVPAAHLSKTLAEILNIAKQIDTVFSLSVISRLETGTNIPDTVIQELNKVNLTYRPNAKINLGLGKPLFTA